MHFALLIGYGATAVNPYLALQTVTALSQEGIIAADPVIAASNYINAVDKGLLKVMSKMGISTLRSYRSGQVFEAVGLSQELIDEFLPGTASRIGGIGLDEIAGEANARRKEADQSDNPLLPDGGVYQYRRDGEQHLWTPASLAAFRQGVQTGDYAKYKVYSKLIDDQAGHLCTLRGLFDFAETAPIPIEEVESVESIVKRFVSGAMSLGSLSPEAHEAIAIAMNTLGGMSNSGEGGEDAIRYTPGPNGEDRSSAIKQIASGRFGVTIDYLRHGRLCVARLSGGTQAGRCVQRDPDDRAQGGEEPGEAGLAGAPGQRHCDRGRKKGGDGGVSGTDVPVLARFHVPEDARQGGGRGRPPDADRALHALG